MTSCHISLVKLKQHLSLFLCLISQRAAQKHATTFNRISLVHFLLSGGCEVFCCFGFFFLGGGVNYFLTVLFPSIPGYWIKLHSAEPPRLHSLSRLKAFSSKGFLFERRSHGKGKQGKALNSAVTHIRHPVLSHTHTLMMLYWYQ